MSEVLFPKMTENGTEPGVLATWYVADGETVAANHLIAEVAIDKVDAEIYAPVAGTVSIRVEEGEEVDQGSVIASID